MATIVCQGLQSCLESSQLAEPRTLRLRLSSPRVPHFSEPPQLTFKSCFLASNTKPPLEEKCHSEENSSNADQGSWSFLEAITNGGQVEPAKADKDQNTYVHPLSKRSSSTLSDKSLELCTENLGSETGTDIIEDSIFSLSESSSSSDSETVNFPTRQQKKSRQLLRTKKSSFPPPLTTISGLESLQVRTHREDGRLIIKAAKAPSPHSLFQAERSHGRLRLSIFKDSLPLLDSKEPEQEEEVTSEFGKEEEIHDRSSEEKEGVEEEGDENGTAYIGEDIDGNILEVGGEMGRKKFQRGGRCKEGESDGQKKNIILLNWEGLWVATKS